MFILYAVVVGLALGLALGGRPSGLGELRFRWAWLFLAGLMVQVVLFSEPVAAVVGGLGAPIYVVSTAFVGAAVLANRTITGMPIVLAGAASNLAAIVANGGYMPASAEAMAALGRSAPTVYSNSSLVATPALAPLTDIFALPLWLPWANVFSIGDVLIAIGVVVVMVAAMMVMVVGVRLFLQPARHIGALFRRIVEAGVEQMLRRYSPVCDWQ